VVRTLVIGAAAALVAGVLVLAGCGDTKVISQQEYTDSVVAARDRVDFALAQITVGSGDLEDLIERMETAADRIDDAADDFDSGGSANGFGDETEELVDAFHQLAAGLAGTAHDASVEGMEDLLTGTNALQFPGWTKANRVLASLDEQGVSVEPIRSH
jgi:uncharacterized phage infection (PIP) family protein YhgE